MVKATPTAPEQCEESETIDEEGGGGDVADVVVVSPDGTETANATDALSDTRWMPVPWDIHGRPFSIQVAMS